MVFVRAFLIGLIIFVLALTGVNWYRNSHRATQTRVDRTKPYHILLLGDSLAQGVGATHQDTAFAGQFLRLAKARYPLADLQNLGLAGAKVEDVLHTQIPQATGAEPNLIVIIVGTNDITGLTALPTFSEEYTKLATQAASFNCPVLILNIPDFSQTPIVPDEIRALAQTKTKQYNDVIVATAKSKPKIKIFDFYSLSHHFLIQEPDLLSDDKFHPNDRGYQIMAKEAAQAVGF